MHQRITLLLVLPLRLTGVMVKEDQVWKFSRLQFQFDVDFSFSMLAVVIITVWIIISMVSLVIVSVRVVKTRRSSRKNPGILP